MAVVMTFCSLNTFAQQSQNGDELRHEVSISYGAAPSSMWIYLFGDIIDAIAGAGYEESTFVGPISAEYFYHPQPALGVGGVFTFNTRHNDMVKNDVKVGERDRSFYTIMPALKYNYLRKKNFGMYLKVAAGVTFGSDKETCDGRPESKDTSSFFNFQLSLLGLEGGSRNLRCFAELGIGEQGILLGGIRYKF